MQAAAAAMVEAYCNELNAGWKKEYLEKTLSETEISPIRGFPIIGRAKRDLDGLGGGKGSTTLTEWISDAALEIGDSGDRGEPDTGSL